MNVPLPNMETKYILNMYKGRNTKLLILEIMHSIIALHNQCITVLGFCPSFGPPRVHTFDTEQIVVTPS